MVTSGAEGHRVHPTMEGREDTREGKPTHTHGQGTCPRVCPARAVVREGMRAEWRMERKGACRMVPTTVATRGAGWRRVHPTLEDREDTREGELTHTPRQGTCPRVCPEGAVAKEGMRSEWRMEYKGTYRVVAATVATSSGTVMSAKDTISTAGRAKWEEDPKWEVGGTTDTDTDTGPG